MVDRVKNILASSLITAQNYYRVVSFYIVRAHACIGGPKKFLLVKCALVHMALWYNAAHCLFIQVRQTGRESRPGYSSASGSVPQTECAMDRRYCQSFSGRGRGRGFSSGTPYAGIELGPGRATSSLPVYIGRHFRCFGHLSL